MTGRIRHYAYNQAGFSLVELLVVMAMIGVLSAIALPNLLSRMAEQQLRSAARGLLFDLQKARMLAVKNNQRITMTFDKANATYSYSYPEPLPNAPNRRVSVIIQLADYGGPGKTISYGVPNNLKLWPPYEDLAFDNPVPSTGTIIFEPKGTALLKFENGQGQEIPTPVGANIFLKNENEDICYAANVNQFGGIKLRRFSGSWE